MKPRTHKVESPAAVSARLAAWQARHGTISAQTAQQPATATVASTGREGVLTVLSAFEELVDRDNLVSLVDLRRAVGLHRWEFDIELRRLRVDGVLVLSAAEGRHGISGEELNAAVRENGELLLYVSRRVD